MNWGGNIPLYGLNNIDKINKILDESNLSIKNISEDIIDKIILKVNSPSYTLHNIDDNGEVIESHKYSVYSFRIGSLRIPNNCHFILYDIDNNYIRGNIIEDKYFYLYFKSLHRDNIIDEILKTFDN